MMEIDDSLFINKKLTREGLVTKGRRSPAAPRNPRNPRNLFVLVHLRMVLFTPTNLSEAKLNRPTSLKGLTFLLCRVDQRDPSKENALVNLEIKAKTRFFPQSFLNL